MIFTGLSRLTGLEMETDKLNTKGGATEDEVFFVPVEYIQIIENVINKLETVRNEFQKVADGMKTISE